MALSESEILQILQLVKESGFGELRLEVGDLKLTVRKGGCLPSAGEERRVERPPASPRPTEPPVAAAPPEPKRPAAGGEEGTVAIVAPLLGTFYRRPSPDAAPYVDVGSLVEEDDTVCIIEVMKVFTSVKAGVRGRIVQIVAENLQLVEYGQPLFRVRPEAGARGEGA